MRSILLLALVATPLAAQRPQTREGFWISFGLGYGSAGISCDQCGTTNRQSSFTSYLRLGGTLNPRVLLGGDIVGWTKSSSGTATTLGTVTASALFYPQPASGFFLKGGVGFAVYDETDGQKVDGAGVGVIVGAGYDIRVGRNISLTAFGDFLIGSVGELQSSGSTVATGWKENLFHFGLGVTFH